MKQIKLFTLLSIFIYGNLNAQNELQLNPASFPLPSNSFYDAIAFKIGNEYEIKILQKDVENNNSFAAYKRNANGASRFIKQFDLSKADNKLTFQPKDEFDVPCFVICRSGNVHLKDKVQYFEKLDFIIDEIITEQSGDDIFINWSAITDKNKDYTFSIEKSTDGFRYTLMDTKLSNKIEQKSFYNFSDKKGEAIYKLNVIKNGTIVYSRIIKDFAMVNSNWSVYPNVTKNTVTLNFASYNQSAKYELYNSMGKIVKQDLLNQQTNTIDLNTLSSGIYFLQVRTDDGSQRTEKIIKE